MKVLNQNELSHIYGGKGCKDVSFVFGIFHCMLILHSQAMADLLADNRVTPQAHGGAVIYQY